MCQSETPMRAALSWVLFLSLAAGAADTLPDLIKKLGDDNFDAREAAEKKIATLSSEHEDEVLPVLTTARQREADVEIRTRLDTIIQKLNVSGTQDWSAEAGQIYQLPAIYKQRVYVGNKDNTTLCYDAVTGQRLWVHENGGFIYKSLAADDGRVFLIRTRKEGRPDGRIFALDALDGHELWSWQDDVRSQYFTAPMVMGGALYFGREKQLICLDVLEGKLRWRHDSDNSILSPPAIAEGRVLYGALDGELP